MKINISPQAFFLLAIAFFPVNYSLAVSMRPADLLVLGSFVLMLFYLSSAKINIAALLWVLFAVTSILFAVFWRLESGGDLEQLIFVYKYIFIFIVLVLALNTFKSRIYLHKASKVFYVVLVLLSLWVFVYYYLVLSGSIRGNIRPSFPFSNSYLESDAHLYSSVLAMLLFSYVYILKDILGHGNKRVLATVTLCLLAMIFTGSRTGIALVFIGLWLQLLSTLIFSAKSTYFISLRRTTVYILMAGFLAASIPVFVTLYSIDLSTYTGLVDRAFNFNLGEDASSLGRFVKFDIALNEFSSSNFIGTGPMHASVDWYDNLIASLLVHGGIVLLTVSFGATLFCFAKGFHKAESGIYLTKPRITFMILLFMYFTANIITEYILVTRSALPSICLIVIAYYWSKYKVDNKELR
ncbi:hypothetical protein CWE09_06000 [Aliidiomarina minuta]|uniref:O-antigen polymerase n=1 Tax=Aliidiomarina minuta TaxID=880057 RepID=A0A432W872_9GAMM|nr:hypothetical protein [Aliidiomarina minuta]RUO26265.1 hypothetical protein CWE09_06000 [Aliidiomarina minuta]